MVIIESKKKVRQTVQVNIYVSAFDCDDDEDASKKFI